MFAEHFVTNLPANHGPVLLLLDGHGSRWSLQALQLLLKNKVYPFFIASHTSIWAQSNDCGLNFCFHRCIEHVCKHAAVAKVSLLMQSTSMKFSPMHGNTTWTKHIKTFFPTSKATTPPVPTRKPECTHLIQTVGHGQRQSKILDNP